MLNSLLRLQRENEKKYDFVIMHIVQIQNMALLSVENNRNHDTDESKARSEFEQKCLTK